MKVDLPENKVENIFVAIVLENSDTSSDDWQAYFINNKDLPVQNVMVSSKGYGMSDGKEVKTSVLRHFVGDVDSKDYARIEPVDPQVFGLSNEYWVSFYYDGVLYDKKFIFEPHSIQSKISVKLGDVEKPGIMLGDSKN